jgi:hypothetical protein
MQISIEEFSNSKNPLMARAAFLLDHILEDVAKEWGYTTSVCPRPEIDGSMMEVLVLNYNKMQKASFIVFNNGDVCRIKSISFVKTGDKVYNDDVQVLDEVETVYSLTDPVDNVENIEDMAKKEEFEAIAAWLLDIMTDNMQKVN